MFLLCFRRKLTALVLCKSIESAIQWFQIHHRITFATMQNPAVYLSGARVSIFSTLVPRLFIINIISQPIEHLNISSAFFFCSNTEMHVILYSTVNIHSALMSSCLSVT